MLHVFVSLPRFEPSAKQSDKVLLYFHLFSEFPSCIQQGPLWRATDMALRFSSSLCFCLLSCVHQVLRYHHPPPPPGPAEPYPINIHQLSCLCLRSFCSTELVRKYGISWLTHTFGGRFLRNYIVQRGVISSEEAMPPDIQTEAIQRFIGGNSVGKVATKGRVRISFNSSKMR